MESYYVGLFPPPYGGVTRKNELLFGELEKRIPIRKIDMEKAKRRPDLLALAVCRLIFTRKPCLVALSTKGRRAVTSLLYRFNRRVLRRSLLFVMGGAFAGEVEKDQAYVKKLSLYKTIYVETEGMKKALSFLGLSSVKVYPNCRKTVPDPGLKRTEKERFSCLFFSRVGKDKGMDLVLAAAKALPEVSFTVYGEIDPAYREEFLDKVRENVAYQGVFRGSLTETVALIAGYDVVLLPTRWKNEGVPGILVEAKFAGVPAIVSSIGYNPEIVRDREEGLVLPENDTENLIRAINTLREEPAFCDRLKEGAKESARRYAVEQYLEDLVKEVNNPRSKDRGLAERSVSPID